MRAAVLHEYGVPRPDEFADPVAADGNVVVEVAAAGLNPVDVAISSGQFYAGKPPLPAVAGREGVGLLDGSRVYFDSPVLPYGSMAQRTLLDPAGTQPVPDGVSDATAVALGISGLAAWFSLTARAKLAAGEHVLVMAASGVLGQIAVQSAKLLGAGRVVAAARSQDGLDRCLRTGADAAVKLDEHEDLAGALRDAGEGRLDVVVDPLFGEPFRAALEAASFGARIIQVGAGAGAESTIASPAIRGKMLVIMGHTNFAESAESKREAYGRLAAGAASGAIEVESEPFALEDVEGAWERLSTGGAHKKIVIVP